MRLRMLTAALVVALAGCSAPGSGGGPSVTDGLPASDHVHALRATDAGGLLLGLHGALWQSPDGTSWEQLGLEGQDAMALGVAVEGQPLLVGGHDVLARSTDGGQSFEMLAPADLPSLDVHALAQAPSEPRTVYAFVVGSGIHVSHDAGDTWEEAATAGDLLPGDLAAMAVDPEDPEVVLVGSGGQGVFRSEDGGQRFERATDTGTLGLAFGAQGMVLAAGAGGIEVSTDGGRSWETAAPLDAFEGQPLAVAVGPDGTWWALTEQPRVLYRDTEGDGDFSEVAAAD